MGVIFLMLYQENECRPHRTVHFPKIEISKPVKKQGNAMVFSTLALFHRLQRTGLGSTAAALIGFCREAGPAWQPLFPGEPCAAQKEVPMSPDLIISKELIFLLVECTESQNFKRSVVIQLKSADTNNYLLAICMS